MRPVSKVCGGVYFVNFCKLKKFASHPLRAKTFYMMGKILPLTHEARKSFRKTSTASFFSISDGVGPSNPPLRVYGYHCELYLLTDQIPEHFNDQRPKANG